MKKILLALIATGLMSTSLLAFDGTVNSVKVQNGIITLEVLGTDNVTLRSNPFIGTVDAIKAMYAMALTAKTSNSDISVYASQIDADTGWASITIK